MESISARIGSFKKSKRVKNLEKPSSTTTLKWPHPSGVKANPETLAEAGFYYDPSYDDPDNVTCYICEKELGGWEVDDDPFLIHWVKCGQMCCWASVRCGLISDLDQSGRFVSSEKTRFPTHKLMEKARLETFSAGKGWIHDKAKNHGANSKMMARAGFVYTPQHSGDDLATCLYCNTSLSGWDAEDDPLEEHRKRSNKSDFSCPFFSVSSSEPALNSKPSSRSQPVKPPSKSQSKAPSRSTSKSKYQDIVIPTKTFDGEEDDTDAAEPNTAQTIAKTPRKPRSTSSSSARKSSAKTPRSKTRSSSRSGLKNVAEEDEEEEAPIEPPPTIKKKPRSRSKSVGRSEVQIEVEDEVTESRKPSRSRSKKPAPETEEEIKEVPRKSSRSKSKAPVAPSATEDEAPRKPSRSKSKAKATESEQEEVPRTTAKPKHQRTTSRSKSKAPAPVSEAESEPEPEVATAAPKKKATRQPKAPQTPAAKDLFNDDLVMDSYVPPPLSPPPAPKFTSTTELPPLFVPKRKTAVKTPIPPEDSEELRPVEKEKKKPGRPKTKAQPTSHFQPPKEESGDEAELPPSKDVYEPLAPVSINPPSQPSSKEKPAAKSKPSAQGAEGLAKQKMKVVEISSDEEPDDTELEKDRKSKNIPQRGKENTRGSVKTLATVQAPPQPQPDTPSRPASAQSKRDKKPIVVETLQPVQPVKTTRPPSPPPVPTVVDADVSMGYIEPDVDVKMDDPPPSTPPRPTIQLPPSKAIKPTIERPTTPPIAKDWAPPVQAEPPFIPALSKLPFMPLHSLSEAELDMTVEEWIRDQMDVEFDKFRRDGERELQRFRKKAEEVRKAIEGL